MSDEIDRETVRYELQAAVNARSGMSTDDELEALWQIADSYSQITGVEMPADPTEDRE